MVRVALSVREIKKRYREKLKNDPARLERERELARLRLAKLKENPEKYAAFCEKRKQRSIEYRKRINSDAKLAEQKRIAHNQYCRDVSKINRNSAEYIQRKRKQNREYAQRKRNLIKSYLLLYKEDCIKNKIQRKKYKTANLQKWRKYQANYQRTLRQNDIKAKILSSLRSRVRSALKAKAARKISPTKELIGCSVENFKKHIESLWLPDMSWENYGTGIGKWVLDHIKPCIKFDLINTEEQQKCFHFSNIQPLWWIHNQFKLHREFSSRDRLIEEYNKIYGN